MAAKFTAMNESFTPKQIRPNANAAGLRFALVVSRFNSFITERLLSGALGALEASGAPEESIAVVRVPGSFEIPLAAEQLAQLDTGIPIIFCVLTCDTLEQAIDRAGLKSGNKGHEAGLAAVEMANL